MTGRGKGLSCPWACPEPCRRARRRLMRYCEGASRPLRLPSGRALSLSKWQAPQSHGLGDEGRDLGFASNDGQRECARKDGARIIARGAATGRSVLIADRWEFEPCAKGLESDPMDADEGAHHS